MKTLLKQFKTCRQNLPEWCKNQKKRTVKWISLMLTFAMFNLAIGCQSYFKVNSSTKPSSESIGGINDAGKTVIVHFNQKKWKLTDIQIKNNIVKGTIMDYYMLPTYKPVNPDRPNRYLTRESNNQRFLLNEAHIYINEYADLGNNQISIPVSSISKIEIYDKDTASTVGSYFLGALGISAAAFLVVGVIAILTKESCPFIYTWDGENYKFAGEIYSGSIHQPLERNDYLKLPSYSHQEEYTLKITNEVREIQHTNLLELLVIDHPQYSDVLMDKYGKIVTLGNPVKPISATNLAGENVTDLVAAKDNQLYQSNSTEINLPLKDGVIMQFPSPGNAKTAKLVLHAKNSIILDYMLGQFHDMLGSAYAGYMKKQKNAPVDKMRQWSLDQGIPLSLYIERNNTWEFVDYYNIAGPMKFKDDVISVPLNGNETNPLRMKLEFGNFLWEIDCASVDYSPELKVKSYTIPVSNAITEDKKDITELINTDDNNYYTQPTMTNQAVVTFKLPELTDQNRTVILHSKGWYEILRNPKGRPDLEKLRAFRNPGHFNRFTNQRMDQMKQMVTQTK